MNAEAMFYDIIPCTGVQKAVSGFNAHYYCFFPVAHIFVVNIPTFQGMQIGSADTDSSSVIVPEEVFSHVTANNTNGK